MQDQTLKAIANTLTSHPQWERMQDQMLKAQWVEHIRKQKDRPLSELFESDWVAYEYEEDLLDLSHPREAMEECPKCVLGCFIWVSGDFVIEKDEYDDLYIVQGGDRWSNTSTALPSEIPENAATFYDRKICVDVRPFSSTHQMLACLSDLGFGTYSSEELADFVDAIL